MVNSYQEKSLLEKFKLSIYQLDYKYIETCTNVKQLEKILKVLRSGEEGVFPDLIKFCESRLRTLDPKNFLLVPSTKILHYRDLTAEERMEITTDLENWSRACSTADVNKEAPEQHRSLPPLRALKPLQRVNDSQSAVSDVDVKKENKTESHKPCTPRSYKDWDKFNVDEELAKVDGGEVADSKREKAESTTPEISTPEISKTVSVKGLSQKERERIANLEKLKGNEAFKAQDYKESVIYYTRSLSAYKTASTYTNRAQAQIKLKNYVEAVSDCNEAINMDPKNLKALYQRGIAYKEAKMYDLAQIDFGIFLELEPNNKLAQAKLQEIESLREQESKVKPRVVIEELESSNLETEDEVTLSSVPGTRTRLTIEEVQEETEKRPLLDEICHCAEDDRDLPQVSRKTRELLSLRTSKKTSRSRPIVVSQKYSKKVAVSEDKTVSTVRWVQTGAKGSEVTEDRLHGDEVVERDSSSNMKDGPIQDNGKEFEGGIISESVSGLKEAQSTIAVAKDEEIRIHENKLTPFEFTHKWHINNANTNHRIGESCLLSIHPKQIPNMLTNKIDAPFLYGILMAIRNLVHSGKVDLGYEYLSNVMTISRIELAALFLSKEEKKDIENLLNNFEELLGKDLIHHRKILKL